MKLASCIALFMIAAATNVQAAPALAPAPKYAYAYDADAAIRPYLPTLCTNYWGIDADDACLGYVHTFSAQYRITTNVFVGHVLEMSDYIRMVSSTTTSTIPRRVTVSIIGTRWRSMDTLRVSLETVVVGAATTTALRGREVAKSFTFSEHYF
ncbi:hypothetical protein HDU98_009006 [Podochytrium sp. JEL0797]|nr:hypothetical protein HDU98_009006 [Podochytrium sp. JEL0797]